MDNLLDFLKVLNFSLKNKELTRKQRDKIVTLARMRQWTELKSYLTGINTKNSEGLKLMISLCG